MARFVQPSLIALGLLLVAAPLANVWAHVDTEPPTVGVATHQTFTTTVPNERDQPTVAVRLVIPKELEHVQPNVKAGWQISVTHDQGNADGRVTEINWSGGAIPAGQREQFLFGAEAPGQPTTLQWKAYQRYEDGTEVAWDQPAGTKEEESGSTGPFSTTEVVNDLNAAQSSSSSLSNWEQVLIPVNLILTLFALYLFWSRRSA